MFCLLQDILKNSTFDIRLRRKCIFLIGDLAQSHIESANKAELPFFSDNLFLKAIVDLTSSEDLDLQEKVPYSNLVLVNLDDKMSSKHSHLNLPY